MGDRAIKDALFAQFAAARGKFRDPDRLDLLDLASSTRPRGRHG